MTKDNWIAFLIIVLLCSCGSGEKKIEQNEENPDKEPTLIGKVLPDWEEGYLDIHAVNTGRGECTFFIFPDGTTMLLDAAGSLISRTEEIPPTPQKPNSSVSPGLVITNYVKHFLKPTLSSKLNYIMLSHFDPDHMGGYSSDLPAGPGGSFRKGGITEVGANIPFDLLIDRGYPSYNFPRNMAGESRMANYIKFIEWAKTAHGSNAEQVAVGRNDQIVLKRQPSKYPSFEVRNLVANGVVWTGSGTAVINTLPDGETLEAQDASENIYSIGFNMAYGKFNYFTAGDLQYNGRTANPWKDIEAPVANVVSAVDVMKANHHGTSNCNSDILIQRLNPQAVIVHPWRDVHPNPETVTRFFSVNANSQIFSTNMTDANKERLGANLPRFKSQQGHIVVRVKPGGDQYDIYVLDDSNQNYKVTRVFGPYQSK